LGLEASHEKTGVGRGYASAAAFDLQEIVEIGKVKLFMAMTNWDS